MSTTLLPAAPVPAAPVPTRRSGPLRAVVALLVGLLGIGLAVALPLAPVVADRTEVTWPSQGEQPTSTTAFFVPYRPAEIQATVPCDVVQAGLGTGERTTLLATSLIRDGGPASGLVVDTEDGRLRVLVNGRLVHSGTPDAAGCDVRVDSDDTATTVAVGDGPPTVLDAEPVPEVFAFTTDLGPEDADGTTVTARTRTWFESTPSAAKLAMIAGYVLVAAVALAMLARWMVAPASRSGEARRAGRVAGRRVRLACDAAVVAALSLWAIIAPQTDDDGYATMTIRNGLASGDIGNYYHWFNASEAPFTLVQHIVQPLAAVSAAPLWLRLPSYLVGLATWFVVSRGVLGAVLPRSSRGTLVAVLSAVFFLAWWLPFNIGVRPEPFVALGAAVVFALLVRGTAPTARRPLLLIGGAALTAGLCLSVTPSSVVALAPVFVLLPRIWRTVRAAGGGAGSSWWSTVGIAALLSALAGSGLVVMFADQSLHGVAKATQLHTEIGPNLEWYEEATRYAFLLGGGSQGTATKRLAVLLTLGLLLVVALLLARRLPELRRFREAHLLAASVALAFALLFVTPSKWSHHFGSLAGLGAPFLALGCVLVLEVARSRSRDRAALVIAAAGTGVVALAAGLAFSGSHSWFMYSVYGLPYRDAPVAPLGVPLGNPALWLVLAAGTVAVAWWMRSRRGQESGPALLAAGPAVVAAVAGAMSVAALLGTFSVAPLRQADAGGYALALENVETLTGTSCGIPESVDVLLDAPGGPLVPAADEEAPIADGFVVGDGFLDGEQPPTAPGSGAATYLWGSLEGGERTVGALVTPWFELPELSADEELAISAAGRTGGANLVELEFGRAEGEEDGVTALARRTVGDGPVGQPAWRPLSLAAADVPATADRVRVVAADATTDVGGWVAVTGPRVRTVESLQDYLDGTGPVLPDWPLAWHLPCVSDFPVVSDGLAETPAVIVGAPNWHGGARIAYIPSEGGSFAGVSQADRQEVPSRLEGAPQEEWGHVIRLDYPLARDQYDRSTDQTMLWGWEGDR
ncbi:arabinosyltransferase domain-containing protein [Blastococcus montanus]|uniref:arabinosyltransferase domain-containing protein n=1 Tax=Blastococcus montanus TaxID=3144973 RepID=UPI0032086281